MPPLNVNAIKVFLPYDVFFLITMHNIYTKVHYEFILMCLRKKFFYFGIEHIHIIFYVQQTLQKCISNLSLKQYYKL